MELLDLEQGSQEWHNERQKSFTASDASAMMGASKYKTRKQLLDEKKGKVFPVSEYQQKLFDRGHLTEELARTLLEVDMLEDFDPQVGVLTFEGMRFLASLDGINNDGSIIFEHKLWNQTLAENVRNNVLEPSHYWQLEHQLLVFAADKVIFVCSDGTKDAWEQMEYVSIPERRQELISRWKQFAIDLENHELEAKSEVVVADDIKLPQLTASVVNGEISTNIDGCLNVIRDLAKEEMDKKLESEQDFANKDAMNKAVKKARENLKKAAAEVQENFVSLDKFKNTVADLDGVLQKLQSHGENAVQKYKDDKKKEMLDNAAGELTDFINECNESIGASVNVMAYLDGQPNWANVIKNKRSPEKMLDALDEEVAKWKVAINQVMENLVPNMEHLRTECQEHKMLFGDFKNLIHQSPEAFQAIASKRIDDHKKAEEEKLEAERKRIQEEEEAKARAKVEAEQKAQIEADEPIEDTEIKPGELVDTSTGEIHSINTSEKSQVCLTNTDLESVAALSIETVSGFRADLLAWSDKHDISLLAFEELEYLLTKHGK